MIPLSPEQEIERDYEKRARTAGTVVAAGLLTLTLGAMSLIGIDAYKRAHEVKPAIILRHDAANRTLGDLRHAKDSLSQIVLSDSHYRTPVIDSNIDDFIKNGRKGTASLDKAISTVVEDMAAMEKTEEFTDYLSQHRKKVYNKLRSIGAYFSLSSLLMSGGVLLVFRNERRKKEALRYLKLQAATTSP